MLVSALTGEGLEELGERIEAEFARALRDVELLLPYREGGRLAELHEVAGDLEREDTPEGVRVKARAAGDGRARASSATRVNGRARRERRHEARASTRPTARLLASSASIPTRSCPSRAYAGDAGLDLHAIEAVTLAPGERASVGTGIAVAIPEGQAGLVLPRSASPPAAGSRSSTRPA